jgi:hypothetical protein
MPEFHTPATIKYGARCCQLLSSPVGYQLVASGGLNAVISQCLSTNFRELSDKSLTDFSGRTENDDGSGGGGGGDRAFGCDVGDFDDDDDDVCFMGVGEFDGDGVIMV